MFENIGWWIYLYTRLDPFISLASGVFYAVPIVAFLWNFGFGLTYSDRNCSWQKDTDWTSFLSLWRTGNFTLVGLVVFAILVTLIVPTKEDAKLIAGVVVGAKVAEQTVEVVSKSELVGKVIDIVEKKIDNTLAEFEETSKKESDREKN